MQISETGRSNDCRGFTVLEILIVLLIFSLTFALVLSGFESGFLGDDYKRNLRFLQDLLNDIRYRAVLEQETEHLMIELDESGQGRYWVGSEEPEFEKKVRKKPLVQGSIRLYGVQKSNGTPINSGVISIAFLPQGLAEECTFFLEGEEAGLAVTMQAVSPQVLTRQVPVSAWQP